jgi:outer membrane protein OmpA-like peptidoglycan-associated protein
LVTDFKGNPKADEAVIFASEKSGKTVKKTTGADGTFKILLPKGDTYHIRYKSLIGEKQSSSIEVPDEPGIMEATLTVQMESMANEVFELDIHFETDKATIKPESYGLLNDLVEQMQKKPALSIEITGHTDDVGEAGYNQALSERRATSVRDYMASKGISANRIKTQGKGESQPKVTNNSDVNRAINRRTEVRILSGWD